MTRRLCIVSPRHGELYAYLRRRFAATATVEVILDRRRSDRTQRPFLVRGNERRSRPEVDARLRLHSHVIVTIEDRSERNVA
jgi:hypothetical protein